MCVPNRTVVPGFGLHENTCLDGQVLPAEVARSVIVLQQSCNKSVGALLQLCCEHVLPAELAWSVSCIRAATEHATAATELQQLQQFCNRASSAGRTWSYTHVFSCRPNPGTTVSLRTHTHTHTHKLFLSFSLSLSHTHAQVGGIGSLICHSLTRV